MKLTFAANHGEMGGGEVMLFAMAEIARDLGHDVTVVAPSTPRDVVERSQKLGFRVIEIHAESAAAYLRALRRWDTEEREGILWCNGLRPAFATAGQPHRVVHLHQLPEGKLVPLSQLAARGASAVVVPSQFIEARVRFETEVLPNWTAEIAPAPTSPAPGEAPVRLGFLGRVTMAKGIGQLCEAVQLLNQQGGKLQLVLGGESRFADREEQRQVEAALQSVKGSVERLGWVTPQDFHQSVDLVVVPSVQDESFGLVAAETMAAGKPLVITNAGALPEIVGRDYPWIARKGSAIDLARVIRLATAQPAPALIRDNRARWMDHYSPAAGRERFAAFLDQLERQQS